MLVTLILCTALIGIDRLIKLWAVQNLAPVGSMPLIPHVIELRYIENDGAAFSLFSGMQTMLILLTGTVLLAGAYILLFRRPKDRLAYTAILLLFSGGVGNLIDRVANGYVVDYFATLFIDFAVFNFADILVCVGVGLLLLAFFRAERREQQCKRQQADEAAEQGGDGPTAPQQATEGGYGED